MKKTNITKTILLISILALLQFAANAQKAELVVQTGHTDVVRSVAFSPDGKIIGSGSDDNTVKLWDAATGQELRTLSGHTNIIRSVAFSLDGKIVASESRDNTLKLWDAATGRILKSFPRNDPKTVAEVLEIVPALYNSQNNHFDPISPNGKFQIRRSRNSKKPNRPTCSSSICRDTALRSTKAATPATLIFI